ncbi:MAG TPA: SelB C-terminal domain-containing protein, partial [Candidatus Binatus sp.]|nr:SelB C-terminal domain-containing protein [Candidatus Binatus sp.]
LWTDSVDAVLGTSVAASLLLDPDPQRGPAARGGLPAILRLGQPIAAAIGARAVLRDPGSSRVVAGVTVLDPRPPRGVSRRRSVPRRLAALATAVQARHRSGAGPADVQAALVELHGFRDGNLADDVATALERLALDRIDRGGSEGLSVSELRAGLDRELRRLVTVERSAGATARAATDGLIAGLVAAGRLDRTGDRLVMPERRADLDDAAAGAMVRLESLLDANVPPPLAEAARAAGCSPDALRQLEATGRVVRVEDDLAWSASRFAALRALAVDMARNGSLTPAAFRDAIGGNRRIALSLLEELGRRDVLRRTDAGHVPGPRA